MMRVVVFWAALAVVFCLLVSIGGQVFAADYEEVCCKPRQEYPGYQQQVPAQPYPGYAFQQQPIVGYVAGAPKPVYLFMDSVLSSVLEFSSFGYGKIAFKETSVMFGLHDQPVVEEELRVFTR